MEYIDFNKKVLAFYTENTVSSFCSFSIDISEFEKLVEVKKIKTCPELKSWNELLGQINGIPQYFGLIAIQCYAAALMHDDGDNGANAYQVRLRALLGLRDNNELQSLFRGNNPKKPVQEQIWMNARRFMKSKFAWDLQLPKRNMGAGRYVQFPKSQSLLHLEDLRAFTLFFSQEFRPGETVPFDFFKERLQARLLNIEVSKSCEDCFTEADKKERCIRQVFNFFNAWDGVIFTRPVNQKSKSPAIHSPAVREKRLVLMTEEGEMEFYWLEKSRLAKITPDEILTEKSYRFYHKDIWLFNEMEYYTNEFVESRFLLKNSTAYVLIHVTRRAAQDQALRTLCISYTKISPSLVLYKCNSHELSGIPAFSKYVVKTNPARLLGGLKADRSKRYLAGYGPVIDCEEDYIVLCNNEICNYESSSVKPGQYKVRTDHYADIQFEMATFPFSYRKTETLGVGWNLITCEHDRENHLEGCLVHPIKEMNAEEGIRSWIQVNLGKKYTGTNILLKAISNAKQ